MAPKRRHGRNWQAALFMIICTAAVTSALCRLVVLFVLHEDQISKTIAEPNALTSPSVAELVTQLRRGENKLKEVERLVQEASSALQGLLEDTEAIEAVEATTEITRIGLLNSEREVVDSATGVTQHMPSKPETITELHRGKGVTAAERHTGIGVVDTRETLAAQEADLNIVASSNGQEGGLKDKSEGKALRDVGRQPLGEKGATVVVEGHPLLYMDESAFIGAVLGDTVREYGPTMGTFHGHPCEQDFGAELIERWRSTEKSYCSPTEDGGSSVDCYFLHQTEHGGAGDNLCLMQNVVVEFGPFYGNEQLLRNVMAEYKKSKHNTQPYVPWHSGFIRGNCAKNTQDWGASHFPGWNTEMVYRGFEQADVRVAPGSSDCDVFIDHPVVFIQRDTFANFFHDSEDFFNLFLTLHILKWTIGETQAFLLDLYPEGPFWSVWETVFGRTKKPLTAWQIHEQFGSKKVCFAKAAMGIYGPAATITLCSRDTPCTHSSLVRQYSDVFIRGFELQDLALRKSPLAKSAKHVVVTFMARRTSEWPEKVHCGTGFFPCSYFDHLGARILQRQVKNEEELTRTLKSLEKKSFQNGAIVEVRVKDYNTLSFQDQIRNDVETDIMIGPHGAGLQHSLYMRDRGRLIEMNIDGTGGRRHFHNMAMWHGRSYVGLKNIANPVPVQEVYVSVSQAIEALDLDSY